MSILRKSQLLKFIVSMMIIAIFNVSCDPNGDIVNGQLIENQIEDYLETQCLNYSQNELDQINTLMQEVTSYASINNSKYQIGAVNKYDLMTYAIERVEHYNYIEPLTQADKDTIIKVFSVDGEYSLNTNNHDALYGYLVNTNRISQLERDFLNDMEEELIVSENENEVISTLNEFITKMNSDSTLSSSFKSGLNASLDNIEKVMCADRSISSFKTGDENQINSRCQVQLCIEQKTEVLFLIEAVIAIIAVITILFGIFGFIASWILVVIVISLWIIVPILYCIFVDCNECPEGTTPSCLQGYSLDENGDCFSDTHVIIGGGLFTMKIGGQCPLGTFDTGQGTDYDCALGPIENFGPFYPSEMILWEGNGGNYHNSVCN